MAAPICNPPMPLLTQIPGGFLHGKIIRIQGSVSPAAQRFAINLQCGPNTNPRDDMALHFNVRMAERIVVKNSLLNGQWGQEERHASIFPFIPGQGFELLLMASQNQYKIAINGQHFAEFHCRTPMERVCFLTGDGDAMITMIHFEGGSPPGGMPGQVHPGGMPGHMQPMPGHMGSMPGMHQPGYSAPGHAGVPYPAQPGMPYNPSQPYPAQPGMPYPGQPGMHPTAGYPGQPGMHPTAGYPGQYGHLSPKSAKKAAKKQHKAQKKALKYGLPLAGVGVGAYALHRGMKHHGHHGHHGSSSSSSSSSEEE